jgi:hypothetical protein
MKGTIIANLLKANADLLALVNPDNIFPYVAGEGTLLPLIIYSIDSLDPEYTKDGWHDDICGFSVTSYSADYSNLQDIVEQTRKALELKYTDDTKKIIITGQSEGYNISEDVYLNKMSFKVEIINN